MYWMEMLVDSGALRNGQGKRLLKEADEIIAMTVASIKTLRKRSAGANPRSLKPYGDAEVGENIAKSKVANPKSKI
jgi:hypothetical protein